MDHKPRVLFLSVGDSTRSQIVEGFLRTFAGDESPAPEAGGVSSKADMPCALQPLYLQGLTVICSETLFLILSPFGPIHVFRS